MNRQPPYADVSTNPYGPSRMQMQQLSAQKLQENTAINNFEGRPDYFPAVPGNVPYISSQWNTDGPQVPNQNQMLPQLYPDARQGSNSVSQFQGLVLDSRTDFEKQANGETGLESHEQDMEIGYEDKPQHLTFEGLERRFQDEILKLIAEQIHSEDAENSRHREKIMEIKNTYQERLIALRAQQANRREEFLKKESAERLQMYQQSGISNPMIRTSSTNIHGHARPVTTEAHQAYASGHTNHSDSYIEQSPFPGRVQGTVEQSPFPGRVQGTVGRVPYPQGRVYNNAGARF